MAERVVVVGGGLIGLATAYACARAGREVTVLEKEPDVARHQSGHNSGVLHAGLYYAPGSLKARLAVSGIRRMRRFCEEEGIAHEICGKLVVATRADELPRLRTLLERGTANGLSGLRWLEADAAREVEPHVAAVAAVHVPEEGIVDYPSVARALVRRVGDLGGRVVLGAEARTLRRSAGVWTVETTAGAFEGERLVTCAGLQADRVARAAGVRGGPRILPFRGEYFRLRASAEHLVRHLIYPVPDPAFPFLGVHFTRMVGGGVEAGPNAVLALAREGYRWRTVNARDTAEALTYPGLWRFLARHARTSAAEVVRSASRRRFAAALQRLVPALEVDDLEPGGAGVRAQAMTADGTLVQDFAFERGEGALHVINAPSPGATASLAIGDEIATALLAS